MPVQTPQPQRSFPLFRAGVITLIPLAAAALAFAAILPVSLSSEGPVFTAAAYVSFMVRVFWFHIGVGLIPLVVLAVWLRLRRFALLGGLLLAWTIAPALWSMRPRSIEAVPGPTLTVMSMNLLLINRDTDAILAQIKAHDPDVILFQEYTPQAHQFLSAALVARYPHHVNAGREDAFGQATYSRIPFVDAPVSHPQFKDSAERRPHGFVGSDDPQVRISVSLGGREIVIQNVHFSPPVGFDYFRDQRRMFAWLGDWAAGEHRPVIVGGDVNATPDTAEVQSLNAAGLRNSHAAAGRGRGSSWPDTSFLRFFPGVKIDQLLFKGLKCDFAAVGGPTGSDHRPIIARFGFAD